MNRRDLVQKVLQGGTVLVVIPSVLTSCSKDPVTILTLTTTYNKTTDGTGIGAFISSITGLILSTTYYVRAYATNSLGTAYGSERSFITNPGSTITIDLSLPENLSLNTAGGSKIVQNILVANTGGGAFIALSSICTHQGCTVGYNSGAGNIQCPCHGSVYTTTGIVVTGPAPTALRSYSISKLGNILTISLL